MVSGPAGILRLAEIGPLGRVVSSILDKSGSPYSILFGPCIPLSDSLETCMRMGQVMWHTTVQGWLVRDPGSSHPVS